MIGLIILSISIFFTSLWLYSGGMDYIDDWEEGVKNIFKRK